MRVTTLVEKFLSGKVDMDDLESPFDFSDAYTHLDRLNTHDSLNIVLQGGSWGNELLEKTKPWELAKQGKPEEVEQILTKLCRLLLDLSKVLSIFLPKASQEIYDLLTADTIVKAQPMFPKVELED